MFRNIFLATIFCLSFNCMFAEQSGETNILSENPFMDTASYKLPGMSKVSMNDKGTVLSIDTTSSSDQWHKFLEFKPGIFQPNKLYTIEIKYKISEIGDEGMLFFIVRNLKKAENGVIDDLASVTPVSTSEKYKVARLIFKTPEDSSDYAFVIHGHKKFKAKVKGLKIFDGFDSSCAYKPSPDAEPYEAEIKKLPTGCEDFEVALPQPAENAPTLNAKDFGVSEDAAGWENFANLQKAIDECKKVKAAKLVLNKGNYKIYNLKNSAPLNFNGMENFEFDASGSTLTFWKSGGAHFDIRNCQKVKFSNINIDWNWKDDPIVSIVKIENCGELQDKTKYIDLKFTEYEKFPKRDNLRTAILVTYNPKDKSRTNDWGIGIALGASKQQGMKYEWLSDNILRMSGPQITRFPEKGKEMFLQHYYYDRNAFQLYDNKNMTLQNINIYSVPGHAFVVGGTQQYFQFLNVNIKLPPNSDRPKITCSADHLHFTRSCGYFKMIGCEFSYGVDDCANFHDCSGFARRHTDYSLMTQNTEGFPKGTKVELRQGDYSPANFIGTVKETIPVNPAKRVYEVVFEEKLPEQKYDGFVMFNTAYNTHNLFIKDCHFHDTVCRGLLILCRDTTIENCRFERHNMGALKFETGYTFNVWSEGYGVKNVVVRNCKFYKSNIAEHKHGGYARDIFMGVYMKKDPTDVGTMYPIISDILIENNIFEESSGLIAYISSTGNVTIRNNKFINNESMKSDFPYRAGFYVTYSSNTKIVNNTWVQSKYAPYPAVFYDPATTKNLIAKGNKIISE